MPPITTQIDVKYVYFKGQLKVTALNLSHMGIKGLTKALSSIAPGAVTKIPASDLKSSGITSVGIDVSSYLYPSQYNKEAKGKGSHIRSLFEMICQFYAVGISCVPVFDGDTYSDAKKATLEARAARRTATNESVVGLLGDMIGVNGESTIGVNGANTIGVNGESTIGVNGENTIGVNGESTIGVNGEDTIPLATEMATEEPSLAICVDIKELAQTMIRRGEGTAEQRQKLAQLVKRDIRISSQEIQDVVTLFDMLGCLYFQAPYEADFTLADLCKSGVIDAVVSEDKDMLTHGVPYLISGLIDATCRRTGQVVLYNLKTILSVSKLSFEQFVDYCILLGCDYCGTITGVAAAKGYHYIKQYGSMDGIIAAINGNMMRYRPLGELSDFQQQYKRAFSIFVREHHQIDLPRLSSYPINMEIRDWLLKNTNYTAATLDKKIQLLTSVETSQPTAAPITKLRLVPKLKVPVSTDTAMTETPKIRIRVLPKLRQPTVL